MPIFRKEVLSAKRKERLRKISGTQVVIKSGKRSQFARVLAKDWRLKNAPFSVINHFFYDQPQKVINDFLAKNPNKKMNVLDWGCFDGRAVRDLAKNNSLNVFGFSRDAHPQMLKPRNATFLNTEKPQLIRYLKKHKIKLDLVFSRMGMQYVSYEELVPHLIELKECLSIGGKIFPGVIGFQAHSKEIDLLESKGYRFDYDGEFVISLTRVK